VSELLALAGAVGPVVFLWFIAASVLAVQFVFQDPRFDYRLLIVGVLAPDLVDVIFGGARVLHTLSFSVALMTVIMLATRNRRAVRKRFLPLAIGTFLHLIFDGAFASTNVFWWPFTGWSFGDAALPVVDRGALNIVFEVLGLVGVIFIVKRHGLGEASRRREFLRTGVLQVVE
jgi:hypothetical protein